MPTIYCPECGYAFDASGDLARCPDCGAMVAVSHPVVQRDEVIDVTARAEDGTPVSAPPPEQEDSRPFYEERRFAGRVFPGGAFMQGRTVVFRAGGPGEADARGCCGCGCLIAALLMFIFLRGCATLIH